MNIRRVPAMALAVSLLLLSSYGQDGEPRTPIIVGDGSIHIRFIGSPFDPTHWITTNKKQYRTIDNALMFGRVWLVGIPKGGDWSTPQYIEPIANFSYAGGQVKVTIAGPKGDEVITVADERGNRGVTVKSKMGLREFYKLSDKIGTELINTGDWTIKQIEFLPRRGAASKPPDAGYLRNCRDKYAGCGIAIDVFSGTALRRSEKIR